MITNQVEIIALIEERISRYDRHLFNATGGGADYVTRSFSETISKLEELSLLCTALRLRVIEAEKQISKLTPHEHVFKCEVCGEKHT